jgi:asparagine synthase (glutamine-hydrolysing)
MCGIAGVRNPRSQEVESMLRAIVHRGPDDQGDIQKGSWHIGMRRLAVIDVADGHQPMLSQNGNWALVMNGEIYNFQELRSKLERSGVVFRTHSDTEVLVEAISAWGVPPALEQAEGMFAIAVVDAGSGTLWLARDRFGEKPLFIDRREGGFAFCSELAPLLRRGLRREIDQQALTLLLRLSYPFPGTTVVFGISELLPAHWLRVDKSGTETQGRYWAPPDRVDEECGSAEKCGERLLELLDESVRQRLISDVPLGLFLSGGIDSGAVAASAVRFANVNAVTVGFGNSTFDERPLARATASELGIDLKEEFGSVDAFNVNAFDEYLEHYGQPFTDTSAFPTRAVSRSARKHYTVTLSGDGGDELLGGYLSHLRLMKLNRFGGGRVGSTISKTVARLFRGESADRIGRALRINGSIADGFLFWEFAGVFDDAAMKSLTGEEYEAMIAAAREEISRTAVGVDDPLLALSLHQLKTSMPQDILMKVDRMSMAESLEVRAPMLDSRFASYALSLPTRLKVEAGKGKAVLRKALASRLPNEVLNAPKRGFAMPVHEWLTSDFWFALRMEVADYRRSGGAELDPAALERIVSRDAATCARKYSYRALHRSFLLYSFLRWRKLWVVADDRALRASA